MNAVCDLLSYDRIICTFSGGKDSLACLLHVLEAGYPRERIELWHHDIDGRNGQFMDWPVTPHYCNAIAEHLGIPIYHSWREGGFLREMLRDGTPTAPTHWECPGGCMGCTGGKGPAGTRRKFPQVSADLKTRYCSASLKIDCCDRALQNQARFHGSRTLVLTGERAQESAGRAKYKPFVVHRADARKGRLGRHIDHWRPVHAWPEEQVWDIIQRHGINPHPCYALGWGRCSCVACIFGSPNQWASLYQIAPSVVRRISDYEAEFGVTIRRKDAIKDIITKGVPYPDMDPVIVQQAFREDYTQPVWVPEWKLPQGAFGESNGPT